MGVVVRRMMVARDVEVGVRPVGTAAQWSVMIPTYRPSEHLREAILSARQSLDACGASVQLEIVDDASPDVDVSALLVCWGIEGVLVFRRPHNGGLGACWNTCIERARGELIHILHQDDLVKPEFYERMQRAAREFPQAGMIFCRTEFLETRGSRLDALEQPGEGLIENWLGRITTGQRLQCPSVVVREDTYRRVGHFDKSLRYIIDWEMWVRIAAHVPVAYVPGALAVYRIHEAAETRRIKNDAAVTIDLVNGLTSTRKTLLATGHSNCLPNVQAHAVRVSGYAIYEAECARDTQAAAREAWVSMRYLWRILGVSGIFARLCWYLRIRLRALR